MPRGFFDADRNLLRELDDGDHQAILAVGGQVAKQYTCLVAKNGGRPVHLGSGTFVQVGIRTFVATAKHLFEGIEGDEVIALYWSEDDRRAGAHRRMIACDENLDLAVIPVDNIPPCGVTLGNLGADCPCTPNDSFVVSGIPGQGFFIDEATKTITSNYLSLGLAGLPETEWPKTKTETVKPPSNDVDMFLNYTKDFSDDQDNPMLPIDPHGFSGGGIWSVPKQTSDTVWSPGASKLTAVEYSLGIVGQKWKYLRATRITHWLRLLALAHPETQDDIHSEFPDMCFDTIRGSGHTGVKS